MMDHRIWRAFALIVFAALSAGCTEAANMPVECQIKGSKNLPSGGSEEELCASINSKINAALARLNQKAAGNVVAVNVNLTRRGSAIAAVKQKIDGEWVVYPEIAVDVMDRALRQSDLENLTDLIVTTITQ